ncbi:hypothetical protein F511_43272 [Dorcoceras hygrometricum]|uniref:Uncharacterized protein n=1 Tax=Dorcoceras hygrometricum TaxID=472368 RepID=A0A2Z7CTZ1_9LAMI|nr:hypothetical protein F511_43272 [Dorcoceras hygrometricum]
MRYTGVTRSSSNKHPDSNMQSMEFKLRSMNSHIEQLLNTQTFLKLDFGRHKFIIYEKKQQFTEDLDMVKLQLSELVEHLKQIGNDKNGEGGQSRPEEVLNRSGEEGSSGGQSCIWGRGGPSSRGGRGSSPRNQLDTGIYRNQLRILNQLKSKSIQVTVQYSERENQLGIGQRIPAKTETT